MKRGDFRGYCFFVLAVLLLGGVAIQAATLYLCGIILPMCFFRRKLSASSLAFGGMGLALVLLHFTFVVGNLLKILFGDQPSQDIVFSKFIAGEFSSALLISAFFLLGLAALSCREKRLSPSVDLSLGTIRPMKLFCYGMLLGSVILLLYGLVQSATGFDFNHLNAYRPDRLLPNGFYRICGFSSHPVPFAGLTLAVMAFFAYLTAVPPYAQRRTRLVTAAIFIIHFVLILLSGSRMAALAAMLVLVVIFLYHVRISPKRKAIILGAGAAGCLLLIAASGLIYRFEESLGNSAVSGFGERATFWKVHWAIFLQNPWLGTGVYWLKNGGREVWYNTLGFAGFANKFNAHNIFLELLVQLGVIGFAVLASCLLAFAKLLKRGLVRGNRAVFYRALRAAFAAELLMGLTENTLGDALVVIMLLGFLWVILWDEIVV